MKKHIKKFTSHPLISGSFVVFAGSFFINGFNYLFNLIMGRMLPVAEYGLLVALIALITIIAIFQTSLSQLFTRFSARYNAQGRDDLKGSLFYKGIKITLVIGVIIFFALLIFAAPISYFLHVNNPLLIAMVFFCILISIFSSLPMGILQGELKFLQVSILNAVGMGSKICVGIILVMFGFGVTGAMVGVLFAYVVPYLLAMYLNRGRKGKATAKSHLDFYKEFKIISVPFMLASIGIIIFQSADVIFARHFLSGEQSGQFAALALMGKAIFYVTAPLYFVFFPLIMHKHEKKESTFGTLMLTLGIVLLCNLFFCAVYILFPNIILSVFFPQPSYAVLSGLLGMYSIYVLIFSLAFLIHTYLLSIGKTGIYKPSISIAVFFIILLFFFHTSITEITYVLIASSFLLLIALLVYYKRSEAN